MKKAIIYTRKNIDGHYQSISGQIKECQEYATLNEINICGIFGEYGNIDPEKYIGEIILIQALRFCNENDVDLILLQSPNTISRNSEVLIEILNVAENLGIKFFFIDGEFSL